MGREYGDRLREIMQLQALNLPHVHIYDTFKNIISTKALTTYMSNVVYAH